MFKKFFNRKKSAAQSEARDRNFDTWLITNEFVMNALKGRAESLINISQLSDFSGGLMQGLQHQERLDEQEFKERLHAVCPKCGIRLTGEGIMMVSMIKRFDNPAFGGGSKKTERILNGLCANEECTSKEIIIEWDG